jgi:hypothetical protein
MKHPLVDITVNGKDCSSSVTEIWTSEELEAIGRTFLRAAMAVRSREHGDVRCEHNLASIGVDCGGDFDEHEGLPVLAEIFVGKSQRRRTA